MEETLAIIKPIAVKLGHIGDIISMVENNGFYILAIKKVFLSKEKAQAFYQVHREKDFFDSLVDFMISGPVIVIVLEKENAVEEWRELIGFTDPIKAKVGTIRKLYALSKEMNAVHGSDCLENAGTEINFFFKKDEIIKD